MKRDHNWAEKVCPWQQMSQWEWEVEITDKDGRSTVIIVNGISERAALNAAESWCEDNGWYAISGIEVLGRAS
jgi:hypothetical protein